MIITVEKINEVHLRVFADFGIESELVDFFTYDFPGAKFTPQYRNRLWDGKVRLYDQLRKTLYVGLLPYIYKFAETRGYEVSVDDAITPEVDVSEDDVLAYAESLTLCGRGAPIEIRDYQIEAVYHALKYNRKVLLSPTGSGKSLIIYTIARWHLERNRKVIVMVPTTSLVEQMYSDFEDYSTLNKWDVSDHCQKLYSGFPKIFDKDILFTTWQSAYTMPKQWFQQFDVMIGDEAHQFKAKSLTTIMDRMPNVKYRIGTTGSLDDKKINQLVLEGIFGKVHRVTTTKKLQDEGKLADLKITAILLKYPDEVRKECNKMDYQSEIDFLVKNESRNKFIRNLAVNSKGNTLVLFQFVEKHGKQLYDLIKDKISDRNVYYIDKDVKTADRERIRKGLSQESNAIVVASFGTSSTGINIPSIENIIFASPSKSIIRNLQSIGRGLRLNEGKTHCNLYDLTDDLHWKSWKNHTLKHGAERYKLYTQEEFSIKLVEVEL